MSRVLLFAPWARYSPHFETDLELLQDHLDAGDDVDFIGCEAELPACDRNPQHDLVRCNMCIGRREAGLAMLSAPVHRVPLLALSDEAKAELEQLRTDFGDATELASFRIEEFDVGTAVLSSLVSFERDSGLTARESRAKVRDLIVASLAVYRSIQQHLERTDYDRVYIFNGRFAITRAVLRACQSRGVDCYTHDRGHDLDHYALFQNTTIHDLALMDRSIQESWNAAEPAERERIGALFYEDRARGHMQNWHSFTANQKRGQLPAGFDATRRNIVVFNSSQDEFVAIGDEWRNPLYDSQEGAVARIAESLAGAPCTQVILRVHPNLGGQDNAQTRAIGAIAESRVTVVPADSPVSTYDLLRAADTVVTFGSTVGMEAVYWGIPSVLAGQCFYRRLGGVHVPETHEELVEMLCSELTPGPKLPALMYGYHMNSFGEPFRHYVSEGVFDGKFKGARVRPTLPRLGLAAFLKAVRPVERIARRRALVSVRKRLSC